MPISIEKEYSTTISFSVNFTENSTGFGSLQILFGINSSAAEAGFGVSFSSLRIFPLRTIFLNVSIAPIILVFPDAFDP